MVGGDAVGSRANDWRSMLLRGRNGCSKVNSQLMANGVLCFKWGQKSTIGYPPPPLLVKYQWPMANGGRCYVFGVSNSDGSNPFEYPPLNSIQGCSVLCISNGDGNQTLSTLPPPPIPLPLFNGQRPVVSGVWCSVFQMATGINHEGPPPPGTLPTPQSFCCRCRCA